ncbi:MAG: D-alanine:D-lactate ligase-like protein [Rhizobiaceae bacterium]|nr:D-alanine:D-lactate ligase-like protein [Rhizobiaceae bacterium]
MSDRTLLLVHEPEAACRARLAADGFPPDRALEISSYLAQSTDIAPELAAIAEACARRGIAFAAVELDSLAIALDMHDAANTLVWTLTDGIAYYRGGASPALARLKGFRTVGADDSTFALCQDKFRSGAVLRALGLPAPAGGLARDGRWIVPPPASASGYFVKPNRLGSKIGIWPDSRCASAGDALDLSRRIFAHYRDDAIVQPYVAGRNVRVSFLGAKRGAGAEAARAYFVDAGGDFQTMAESLALYGETGEAAKAAGAYAEPALVDVGEARPDAAAAIRDVAARLIDGLGLRDVFSVDLRLEDDGTLHLIEFEVCPGLPCFDFRAYCRRHWRMELADAIAATAALRLA